MRTSPLQPWHEVAVHEQAQTVLHGASGAAAVFVGHMRDFNEGDNVTAMQLEHYPGMTERYLSKIAQSAFTQWALLDALIIHRVGELHPADPIVLVAVWSAHRKDAFSACRYLMEELKSTAPFWKKEQLEDGSERWVEQNTAGY
ncbi:MAG: molybdenum cofactor biosynthesis protein MoaE [Thiohalomonadaceae bacterium]